MITEAQKEEYFALVEKQWKQRLPYILLAYVVYPFIQRTKTREKYHSGKGGWWNRQLWDMINDDEVGKPQNKGYDFDLEMFKREKNWSLKTRWGRFRATYWFNVGRNKAYNKAQEDYDDPFDPDNYKVLEKTTDELYQDGEKIHPIEFAEWRTGKIGEAECWFRPSPKSLNVRCRASFARKRKVLFFFTVKEEFQFGDFGDRHDIKYKWK